MAKTEKPKKEKKAKEPKQADFPVKSFVNAYGFVRLSKDIQSAFGIEKGKKTDVTIDLQDNALIVRKA